MLPHLNFVSLTGFATKDATIRRKASGQIKAEFSFEVNRPFLRATGEPVSDLFLIDVWGDLGRWTAENVKQGSKLVIFGTLNKESYVTRGGGREHLTVVKAKYLRPIDEDLLEGKVDIDEMKKDDWGRATLAAQVNIVDAAIDGSPFDLPRSGDEE
ncbi:MAG TPA: single-stranded DNA-binding protein [Armatimonadota bacterium]|nr:single-stranded DNA-binding protein [Armatimonadota bacterium]